MKEFFSILRTQGPAGSEHTAMGGGYYSETARSCGSTAQALSSSDEKAAKDLKVGEAWRTFPVTGIHIAFLKLLFLRGAWSYF